MRLLKGENEAAQEPVYGFRPHGDEFDIGEIEEGKQTVNPLVEDRLYSQCHGADEEGNWVDDSRPLKGKNRGHE